MLSFSPGSGGLCILPLPCYLPVLHLTVGFASLSESSLPIECLYGINWSIRFEGLIEFLRRRRRVAYFVEKLESSSFQVFPVRVHCKHPQKKQWAPVSASNVEANVSLERRDGDERESKPHVVVGVLKHWDSFVEERKEARQMSALTGEGIGGKANNLTPITRERVCFFVNVPTQEIVCLQDLFLCDIFVVQLIQDSECSRARHWELEPDWILQVLDRLFGSVAVEVEREDWRLLDLVRSCRVIREG